MQCEVIDFYRPVENNRKIFIAKLPTPSENFDPKNFLHKTFSKYGIIYQISVIEGTPSAAVGSSDASAAKIDLSGRLWCKGKILPVSFAKKFNSKDGERQELYYTKSFELANYYLGFNGWTLQHVKSECKDLSDFSSNQGRRIFKTVVKLTLPTFRLHSFGSGVSEAKFNTKDDSEKCNCFWKNRKLSYQLAVQNAFSKLVLVLLNNGKVFPEINTTVEENLKDEPFLDMDNLLQVNNLDSDPEEEEIEVDEEDLEVLLDLLKDSSQD
ncbi:hypothetical protein CAPTEDRAFT_215010 [Capitella teleta]|uniref:DM1 domain-containing protein n=1 Tax=Capitella teleta TaxID=283909 RepID=R7TM25_CAPTE|nr:hypothetical protein CAPTEDRAFT_215010 [Capitella teleta]|eukprot:ELT92150.1 hypothetical protein CAPTEDRAFT_215010 [Capitella teleta]